MRPEKNPTATCRAGSAGRAMQLGLLACLMLTAGCAALRPMNGIPARYLPDELKAPRRSGKKTIDLSLLRQTPPAEYLIDAGDVLGIYIEGVLGRREDVPPVHFPQNQEAPPALGYPIPVRDDGTIALPLVPPVPVRGLTLLGVEQALRRAYTVDKQILKPGRDRILVSLLKSRTYPVLVIRQESGTDVSAVSSTGFNLGRLKRGTGRVVNLPAYRNDVLHALAETGGLPGLDAENTIYIIRSKRRPVAPHAASPAPATTPAPAYGVQTPAGTTGAQHGRTRFPAIPEAGRPEANGSGRGVLPDALSPSAPRGASPPPPDRSGLELPSRQVPGPTVVPPAGGQPPTTPGVPPTGGQPRFPEPPPNGGYPPPPPLGGAQSFLPAWPAAPRGWGMRSSRVEQAAEWSGGPAPSVRQRPVVVRGQSPAAGRGYNPGLPSGGFGAGYAGMPKAVPAQVRWPAGVSGPHAAPQSPAAAMPTGAPPAAATPGVPQVQPVPDPFAGGWSASAPLADGATYGVADWMRHVAGYDAATIENPRITKIPIRLAPGETISFTEQDVILNAGDIVFIESRDTEIFYTGGLLGGGQFTLPRDYDIDVLDAIAIAQGQNNNRGGGGTNGLGFSALNGDVTISASNVIILRRLENGTQVPIKVDLYRALRYPQERVLIRPGDYIVLQYTPVEAVAAFLERHVLQSAIFGIAAAQVSRGR